MTTPEDIDAALNGTAGTLARSRKSGELTQPGQRSKKRGKPAPVEPIRLQPVQPVAAVGSTEDLEQIQIINTALEQVLVQSERRQMLQAALNQATLQAALLENGLSISGTYEDKLERWNAFVEQREQELKRRDMLFQQEFQRTEELLNALGLSMPGGGDGESS